jgi:predicted PurR-regulated permease PerM
MSDWIFVRRVLIVFGLAALAAAVWILSDLLLMVFGAALLALALRALAEPIVRKTGMSEPFALALVLGTALALIAAAILPFASTISHQTSYLIDQLPVAFNTVTQSLQLGSITESLKGSAIGSLVLNAFTWGSALVNALTGLVLVLFGGLYFAAAPDTYRTGLIGLFPEPWQKRISATIEDTRVALNRWMRAQAIAMLLVGLLTGVGMWLIGVPSPVALALIAALTEFVPIVGPILGTIPAVLVASTQGWDLALWAVAVAVVVQQLENNIIMPLLVGRVVQLPAAVGMFSVVAMGIAFGPLGLLLGYPLAIAADIAIRRLYVREALGQNVEISAERERRAEARAACIIP